MMFALLAGAVALVFVALGASGDGPRLLSEVAPVGTPVAEPSAKPDLGRPGIAPATVLAVAAFAMVILFVAGWFAALATVLVVVLGARRRRTKRHDRREREIERAIPTVAVLSATALQSGHGVVAAAGRLAPLIGPPLDAPLKDFANRVQLGSSRADAFDQLALDLGPGGYDLVESLRAAVDEGASVVGALRALADRLRTERRHQTEAALRRLPVLLLLPLVCCVLPAFVLLTVAPAVVETMTQLTR